MGDPMKNEGEGSRSGARQYDEGATQHADKGRSPDEAKKAARDLDDPGERRAMEEAEKVGRGHAKEEDRLLRNPGSPKKP
jgi:hypothetical protein